MNNIKNMMGPMGDPQFWKDVGSNAVSPFNSLKNYGQHVLSIPARADYIASNEFPLSATPRDHGTGNAFRHALGTGMLAQEFGGGPVAAAAAKGIGYLWEGLNPKALVTSAKHRSDTLNDLNANALGATVARQTNNNQELIEALKKMALQSVPSQAPGFFSPSPGYMTRSDR